METRKTDTTGVPEVYRQGVSGKFLAAPGKSKIPATASELALKVGITGEHYVHHLFTQMALSEAVKWNASK